MRTNEKQSFDLLAKIGEWLQQEPETRVLMDSYWMALDEMTFFGLW